jgi:hypothetical protein
MPLDGIFPRVGLAGGDPRTHDAVGNALGKRFSTPYKAYDGKYYDSTGAFLHGELIRLDPTMHLPLAAVTWGRDIDLRQDVTIADDGTSFTQLSYGMPSGMGTPSNIAGGKAWIGKDANQITGVSVDTGLLVKPLRAWAMELKYTIFELESSLRLGRPIDQQKYDGIKLKWQFDIDAQVYAGDADVGAKGLVNMPLQASGVQGVGITTNLPNGAAGSSHWMGLNAKTAAEILADFNYALNQVWQQSAWAVVPSRILLPTQQYGFLATTLVSTAGTTSILRFIEENNLLARSGVGSLEILPCKWCNGAGAGGTLGQAGTVDRMVVYTKDVNYVRFPMTLLQRTPIQYDAIWQKTSYFAKLGEIEVPYGETIGYFDGL